MTNLAELPRFIRLGNDAIVEVSLSSGDGPFDLEVLPPDRSGFWSRLGRGDWTYVYIVESGVGDWLGLVRRNVDDQLEMVDIERRIGTFGDGPKIIFSRDPRGGGQCLQ